MSTRAEEKLLATCSAADIEIEDHGIPVLSVKFEYEDGGTQGFGGYQLDAAFVTRFMVALGVTSLSDVEGKSCWVVQGEDGMIAEVHGLHKKCRGAPFVIKDWQDWLKRRTIPVSARELVTGENPQERRR